MLQSQEPRKVQVPKRGLGRGLASLLPAAFSEELETSNLDTITSQPPPKAMEEAVSRDLKEPPAELARQPAEVKEKSPYFFCSIDDIVPNPHQPRKSFDDLALQELSQSIQIHGLLSPIVVRKSGAHYEIVAGERRWRAARLAGLTKVPVLLKEVGEKAQYQLALIENIQRSNLNAIEEAMGYEHLMEAYGWTQDKVADQMGKSRSSVANYLRLLKLPQPVVDLIREGKISLGHAKALLAFENPSVIKALAQRIATEGLSVREVERASQERKTKDPMEKRADPHLESLKSRMEKHLKCKVEINGGSAKGSVRIHYSSTNQLNAIAEALGVIS